MANYCKKCLRVISDENELCFQCSAEARKKEEAYDNMVNFIGDKIDRVKEKRKICTRCGQPVNIVLSALVKEESAICFKCAEKQVEAERKKEEERKQRLVDERIENMKKGISFLHINRAGQLANAMGLMKVRIFDVESRDFVDVDLINGESIEVDVEGNKCYSIVAKIKGKKESKELVIDIGKGETVYVEITSKSAGSALGTLIRQLSGEEMAACKIIKREFIENDKVVFIEANK